METVRHVQTNTTLSVWMVMGRNIGFRFEISFQITLLSEFSRWCLDLFKVVPRPSLRPIIIFQL